MAEPSALLLYAARLSKAEKEAVLEQDKWFAGLKRFDALRSAIEDAALDRLIRAEGCLTVARRLASSADEEDLRTATGRAYYCIHHAIRAMALWKNKWDPDGHQESIEQFKMMLRDNAFCGLSGLDADVWKKIVRARANRHVADYSPYASQRSAERNELEVISGGKWKDAADFNIGLADEIYRSADKVMMSNV